MTADAGSPIDTAIGRSEDELRASFGLVQPAKVGRGNTMDLLGGDTDDNAYLLAMSCVLAQVAKNEAPSSVDAKLQELVSQIALDLEDDGLLTPTNSALLAAGRAKLDPMRCMNAMKNRALALHSTATVPNIFKAFDYDGDGIADASDPDTDGDGVAAAMDKPVAVARTLAGDTGGNLWGWDSEGNGPFIRATFKGKTVTKAFYGHSSADFHLVLLSDGTLWGISPTAIAPPAQVPGLTQVTTAWPMPNENSLFAIKADGSVWRIDSSKPTLAPEQVTNFFAVKSCVGDPRFASGYLCLKPDGTVWGLPVTGASAPVQVPGLGGVKAVAGTNIYSGGRFVLQEDGTLFQVTFAAGNTLGLKQLGTGFASVSGEGGFAVKADGTLWEIVATLIQPDATLVQVTGLSGIESVTSGDGRVTVTTTDGRILEASDAHGAFEEVWLPR
jgi:hypothetical protein